MTDFATPVLRAVVAISLLLATLALMVVTLNTAHAAGALAIGDCGAFGEAFDFSRVMQARQHALAKCTGRACRVVTVVKGGCAALAVDVNNGCGAHGWGKAGKPGPAQNVALKSCYKDGGKECVIRTFSCDGKG
ncbi:MAG: DUF4189 domain-containing protein [Pseudolabrys sp.]